MVHSLCERGVKEVGTKLEQHCGKQSDGRPVCLPDSLTTQLNEQRDKLVNMYVAIEGRALSEMLEVQV